MSSHITRPWDPPKAKRHNPNNSQRSIPPSFYYSFIVQHKASQRAVEVAVMIIFGVVRIHFSASFIWAQHVKL
jgi:hypothetical protein